MRILLALLCVFSLSWIYSCGGPSKQEMLIGEWLVKDAEVIIVLKANGTWVLKAENAEVENPEAKGQESAEKSKKEEGKKEEAANKEEPKKEEGKKEEGKKTEEESLGLWDIKDKTLMVSVEKDVPQLGWVKGDKFDFEILELTPDQLKLKSSEGHHSEWERVKEKKEDEKKAEAKDDKPLVIEGEPMVINLVQKLQYTKDRYLCLKIDYHFKKPAEATSKDKKKEEEGKKGAEPATPFKYQFIHPAVKDAVIMHLGEIQYRDVRTYEKIKGLRAGIEKRVAPYFGDELIGVVIADAVITSSKDSIDQFFDQYAPPPPKAEGGKEEKGNKQGGSEEKKPAH